MPGSESVGGERAERDAAQRGWIEIPISIPSILPDTPFIILQHPEGGPLQISIDTKGIIGTNTNGTRIFYRTNTTIGSAGSPCFDSNWDLIAMHQGASNKASKVTYKQGIPLTAILTQLEKRGLRNILGEQQKTEERVLIRSTTSKSQRQDLQQATEGERAGIYADAKLIKPWPDNSIEQAHSYIITAKELVEKNQIPFNKNGDIMRRQYIEAIEALNTTKESLKQISLLLDRTLQLPTKSRMDLFVEISIAIAKANTLISYIEDHKTPRQDIKKGFETLKQTLRKLDMYIPGERLDQ